MLLTGIYVVVRGVCTVQDFHCHQLTAEVLGYIGGKWDPTLQRKSLLAFLLASVN